MLTVQTTPANLDDWAVGILLAEGFIASPEEVRRVVADAGRGMVWADAPGIRRPEPAMVRRYLTSGCGRGVTFTSIKDAMQLRPVTSALRVSLEQLRIWWSEANSQTPMYNSTGGMHHAAAVRVDTGDMAVREDIGRHNAVDKVIGAAFRAGWDPAGTVIMTSGRISYDMCARMARFGSAVGATRTAVTDLAVRLAAALGIGLVGYILRKQAAVYTGGGHILDSAEQETEAD